MENIVSIQQLIIGLILIFSGVWKVFSSASLNAASKSSLSVLIKSKAIRNFTFKLLGVIEIGLSLFLLFPPVLKWELYSGIFISLGFITYLAISLKVAPDRPCGCLGNHGKPISIRTISRAIYILILAIFASFSSDHWFSVIRKDPRLVLFCFLELIIFVGLSSELDWLWVKVKNIPIIKTCLSLIPSKQYCKSVDITLTEILERLKNSPVFTSYSAIIKSDMLESWRDDCWFFLNYRIDYQGQEAIIIFSVPVLATSRIVRAAIVDEKEERILLHIDPFDIESLNMSSQLSLS